jgi:hypothetical protein
MRRLVTLAPIALLSTACATRQFTPSTALERYGELADARTVTVPPTADAVAAWQLPTESPWSPYEKTTLLGYLGEASQQIALPDVRRIAAVQRAEIAAVRLAEVGLRADTMWIVDLRGAASVAFGAALSRALPGQIAPVLTFNNWPGEDEVVPAEETLSALVSMHPALPTAAESRAIPVFLLDAWRLAFREEDIEDSRTDNRYYLFPTDLPSAEVLRAQGIRHVVYLVEDRGSAEHEEDDLHDSAADYEAAGIDFNIVDLAWIEGFDSSVDYDVYLRPCRVIIGPRYTVFDRPSFFLRGRGGFGGYSGAGSVSAGKGGRVYTPASPHVGLSPRSHGGGWSHFGGHIGGHSSGGYHGGSHGGSHGGRGGGRGGGGRGGG